MPGHLDFELQWKGAGRALRRDAEALRIVVLGDFGGHGNRRNPQPRPLIERAPLPVDIDNFEQVMARIGPKLVLSFEAASVPACEIDLKEMDDFHPDTLYRRLSLFRALRETRAALLDPKSFSQTAAQLANTAPDLTITNSASTTAPEDDPATLERLLGSRPSTVAPQTAGAASVVTQLIRDIVAPHIVPDADPRQELYVQWLDDSITTQMRAVLHHPHFQSLESAWRSLYEMVSSVETDETLRIFVLDITQDELDEDLSAADDDLQRSVLYRLLMADGPDGPDGEPWSLMTADFTFGPENAMQLAALGAIGAAVGGPLLAAASPQLLGCPDVKGLSDPSSWSEPDRFPQWQSLRESPMASWIGLALPRLLLRLPYGKNGEPVDDFAFEELSELNRQSELLWGNPAFGLAKLIAAAYSASGAGMQPGDLLDLEDRPAYTFADEIGEIKLQSCTQIPLDESTMEKLLARGLIPMLSYRNRNAVRVARFQSIAAPLAELSGQWA